MFFGSGFRNCIWFIIDVSVMFVMFCEVAAMITLLWLLLRDLVPEARLECLLMLSRDSYFFRAFSDSRSKLFL